MFLAICHACGRRELRGPRGIDALVNTEHGIELQFSCRACGTPGAVDAAGAVPALPSRTAVTTAA